MDTVYTGKSKMRSRMRWSLIYTLIRNPQLIQERRHPILIQERSMKLGVFEKARHDLADMLIGKPIVGFTNCALLRQLLS